MSPLGWSGAELWAAVPVWAVAGAGWGWLGGWLGGWLVAMAGGWWPHPTPAIQGLTYDG